MPRRIIVKRKFEHAYFRFSQTDKQIVDVALKNFECYLKTGHAPTGLGIAHLGSRTYEFRAGLALRIVYIAQNDQIVLALLGSHDEVRRFLKNQ